MHLLQNTASNNAHTKGSKMLKKIILTASIVVVIGLLAFGAVTRTSASNENSEAANGGNGRGGRSGQTQGISDTGTGTTSGYGAGANNGVAGTGLTLPAATDSLSAEEAEALLFMREEEKLAHDVYIALYDLWKVNTFTNIAASEQAHMDAVLQLIQRYGLTDSASTQVGVFTNPELQTLYNTLMAQGKLSLADALKVGAAIEEVDIRDLQDLSAKIDNADLLQVFANLEKGSESHLRAFTTALTAQTGETYTPQFLDQDTYTTILAQTSGNGNGYRGGRK
jgi:hypothetical protein